MIRTTSSTIRQCVYAIDGHRPTGLLVATIILLLMIAAGLPAANLGWHTVTRVIDGDTVVLSELGTTRLTGIDTPETVHPNKPVEAFGKEAKEKTEGLVLGKRVKVESDARTRDKYGRLLAYLWMLDGNMLNAELVRLGLARLYTDPPNVKYVEKFRRMEKAARAAQSGIWATASQPEKTQGDERTAPTDTLPDDAIVHITRTGKYYHAAGCRYLAKSDIKITKKEAIARGYKPCKVCIGRK